MSDQLKVIDHQQYQKQFSLIKNQEEDKSQALKKQNTFGQDYLTQLRVSQIDSNNPAFISGLQVQIQQQDKIQDKANQQQASIQQQNILTDIRQKQQQQQTIEKLQEKEQEKDQSKQGLSKLLQLKNLIKTKDKSSINPFNSNFINQQKLINLLQEVKKNNDHGKSIYKLVQNMKFFSKFIAQELGDSDFDETALIEICKNLQYQFFEQGNIIMTEGDDSDDKMYVIINGEVAIIKQHQNYIMQQNQQDTLQNNNTNKKKKKTMNQDELNLLKKDNIEEYLKLIIPQYGNKIAVLGKEDYFGEKAIQNPELKGSKVCNQGTNGNFIYFLQSGMVRIECKIEILDKFLNISQNKIVQLAIHDSGYTIFGEEILFNETGTYQYSCVIESSDSLVYFVSKDDYLKKFPKDTKQKITKDYFLKDKQRKQELQFFQNMFDNQNCHPSEKIVKSKQFEQNHEFYKFLNAQYKNHLLKVSNMEIAKFQEEKGMQFIEPNLSDYQMTKMEKKLSKEYIIEQMLRKVMIRDYFLQWLNSHKQSKIQKEHFEEIESEKMKIVERVLEKQEEDMNYSQISELKQELIRNNLVDPKLVPQTFSKKKYTDAQLRQILEEKNIQIMSQVQTGGLGIDGVYDKNSEKRSLCRLIQLGLYKNKLPDYSENKKKILKKGESQIKMSYEKTLNRQIRREKSLSVIGSTFNTGFNSNFQESQNLLTGNSNQSNEIILRKTRSQTQISFERLMIKNDPLKSNSSRENFFKVLQKQQLFQSTQSTENGNSKFPTLNQPNSKLEQENVIQIDNLFNAKIKNSPIMERKNTQNSLTSSDNNLFNNQNQFNNSTSYNYYKHLKIKKEILDNQIQNNRIRNLNNNILKNQMKQNIIEQTIQESFKAQINFQTKNNQQKFQTQQ